MRRSRVVLDLIKYVLQVFLCVKRAHNNDAFVNFGNNSIREKH